MHRGIYSAPKYLQKYPSAPVKKWPEDIQCIIKSPDPSKGSLYLSNVQAAENPVTVKRLKVGAILSCAKGYELYHPKHLVPHYMYIPGEDKQTFNISEHFQEAVNFIHNALQKTNIIVHCIAGVSRSVSMVLAYLIKVKNMTYEAAFHQVKKHRKIICPNEGFIKHLKRYQQQVRIEFSREKRYQPSTSSGNLRQKLLQKYFGKSSGQVYNPEIIERRNTQKSFKTFQLDTKDSRISQIQQQKKYSYFQYKENVQKPSSIRQEMYEENYYSPQKVRQPQIEQQQDGMVFSFSAKPQKSEQLGRNATMSPKHLQKFTNYNNKSTSLNRRENLLYNQTSSKGYFDSMNHQLNEKIQAIRKKYQQQRTEMLSRYDRPRTGYYSSQKPTKNIQQETNTSFSPTERQNSAKKQRYQLYSDYGREDYNRGRTNPEKAINSTFKSYNMYDELKSSPYLHRIQRLNSIYMPRVSTGYGGFGRRAYF